MNHESAEPVWNAGDRVTDWPFIFRVIIKSLILFLTLNILFGLVRPTDAIGGISLYNHLFPGRARLPYGENLDEDLNLTLNNLPGMFAAHKLNEEKADDEFRVVLLGDSGIWGWFLNNEDTLAGQLNRQNLKSADGRRIVVYNLGYPVMSLTKDLLILDKVMEHDPDLILWPITMQSFARNRQLDHPVLQQNSDAVRGLIADYNLSLDPSDPRLVDRDFLGETIVGRRRDLADLIRLQTLGLGWTATGRDQAIPSDIPLRKSDFEEDESWLDIDSPRPLSEQDLAFDVLRAGLKRTGDVPIVLINEPIYISDGKNSDLRYNSFYPRWAYDAYREMLSGTATAEGWEFLDLWDAIPPGEFTDTPVHLTPEGSRQLAALLASAIQGATD